jgi:pimeloyl-ACP methyl ester carboxylesterase
MSAPLHYAQEVSIPGIRSGVIDNGNGLQMHYLEALPATSLNGPAPTILLLHGFPELAFSWRHVMPSLAQAGYRVIAPDQRGYGATTGWDAEYHGGLRSYHFLNLVRDAMGLLHALGVQSVETVVGHDFGASVAAYCALVRPDMFRKMVLMSAPFSGAPAIETDSSAPLGGVPAITSALRALERPRKHYHAYYTTEQANDDMHSPPQGVHDFLRAYFHHKSADWGANKPFELNEWSAQALAQLPTYYVMDLDDTMPEAVASHMPSPAQIAQCDWLCERDLQVYSTQYGLTGFQGGLNWYRSRLEPQFDRELQVFAGKRIEVPSCFISGASDWGVYQTPGALERMRTEVCNQMSECYLVSGAGHWVQQEQPGVVVERILGFLART